MSKPFFFPSPAAFRDWLNKHHTTEQELIVGYYRKDSGRPSMTWSESVDVALCFGWIDGVRRKVDEESYTIRFTPRKPRSVWSSINLKKVEELTAQGLMQPAGIRAWEARTPDRSSIYAFEQKTVAFDKQQTARFRSVPAAWKFFEAQPPGYRRIATWWVISAKREETRTKRLDQLIALSKNAQRLPQLTRTTN